MRQKEKVTIYDISKKLNISAATVSRALNDSDRVSLKTKELVLKTAKELNYQQNALALALKSGRTFNVGVVVPYINHTFFASVIRGIEEELEPKGYHVIICQTHENVESEAKQIKTLLNTHIDGIFISVSKTTESVKHIEEVRDEGVPLIFFDRKKDISGVSSVTINDFEGAYEATTHLIQQGYTNIAHIGGDHKLEIYKHRYDGYIAALKAHNLPVNDDLLLQVNSTVEAGIEAVKSLLKNNISFDAIFSASDYVALGGMRELRANGFKIPEDVGVVGFSNEPFTKYLERPLTTVGQTPVLMGQIAAQVFLEQITDVKKNFRVEKKVVLSPELYTRDTSIKKGS
ncbi:MAG: LacI family DNA-binding transcriptional regulator [Bacteroidota bacterium]|mgnify:CR=1 FL=1|uniref:LacI family DNA-binding transcriptional regulator n=1 Tax=Leeuwenhoekiella palythoae TaxID=573501 RepID=UPI000C49789B|nr:LacI family transcriptional regulator [Leeuwenhoekiella sp.]MEC7783941.1 LacI family DNA-binding transcriptional regulator [Bacteroidota bacterium]MEC8684014.1 LacI family DNA-binding transcriptional regulator [Bacteroidota bacterium]MEE3244663.1 LacI family DNA-binding transcriptional regulator [Bacteroidota bacterium]HAX14622.1 LacI family transcriptional regulator [Leeuwenhoekiella sp.]|tara:strand:+ start:2896 stop:3930 length:1035 start_codon:yes stop_codon:yes gene_type:complete